MIVTMPVSSMVFFRPLIWLAGSSFAHIFDSGFPRENHVSLLIGTVRPQRDKAFLLAHTFCSFPECLSHSFSTRLLLQHIAPRCWSERWAALPIAGGAT